MSILYADVTVRMTVKFEDNGQDVEADQALDAAAEALGIIAFDFVPEVRFVEMEGEVRGTELPAQPAVGAGAAI